MRESAYADPEAPYDIYGLGAQRLGRLLGRGRRRERGVQEAAVPVPGQYRLGAGGARSPTWACRWAAARAAPSAASRTTARSSPPTASATGRRRLLPADRHVGGIAGVRRRAGAVRAAVRQEEPPHGQRQLLPLRGRRAADPGRRHPGAQRPAVLPPQQSGLQRRRARQLPELQLQLRLRQRQPGRAQAVRPDGLQGRRRAADARAIRRSNCFEDERGVRRAANALFHGWPGLCERLDSTANASGRCHGRASGHADRLSAGSRAGRPGRRLDGNRRLP